MPAIRSEVIDKPQKRVRSADPIACPICDKVLNRKPDLARHMLLHNKSAERYTCEYKGCAYSTLQKSNFTTHVRTHTGEKHHVCKDDPSCTFRTADPAALTRHRKKLHGYIPRSRKSHSAPAEPAVTAGSSSLSAGPSTSTAAASATTTTTTSLTEEYSDSSSDLSSDRSSSASIKTEEFYPSPLGSAAGSSSGSRASSVSDFDDWVLTLDGSPQGSKLLLPTEEYLTNLNTAGLKGLDLPWGTPLSSSSSSPPQYNIFDELFSLPETTTWNPIQKAEPCDWRFKSNANMLNEVVLYSPLPAAPLDPPACGIYFKNDQERSLVAPVSFGEDYLQWFDFIFGNNVVYA